jgi:hypothetical protein
MVSVLIVLKAVNQLQYVMTVSYLALMAAARMT